MNFTISGKLIEIFEEIQISDTFRKREFVVETVENNAGRDFIEQIKFQLIQEKCELIDDYNINDEIKVSFNIRGRRWEKEDKVNYFTNLDAWRIESEANSAADIPPPLEDSDMPEVEEDDVPF